MSKVRASESIIYFLPKQKCPLQSAHKIATNDSAGGARKMKNDARAKKHTAQAEGKNKTATALFI